MLFDALWLNLPGPANASVADPEVTASIGGIKVDRGRHTRARLSVLQAPPRLSRRRKVHLQSVSFPTGAFEHQPLGSLRSHDCELMARQALGQLGLRCVAPHPVHPRRGDPTTTPPIDQRVPHGQGIPSGDSRSARPRVLGSAQKCPSTDAPPNRLTSRCKGRMRTSEERGSSPRPKSRCSSSSTA